MTINKILTKIMKIDERSKFCLEMLETNKLPKEFIMPILYARPYWKNFNATVPVTVNKSIVLIKI